MKKQFYIQLEPNTNRITDIADDEVTSLANGYIPIKLDTPLPNRPATITSQCYELLAGDSVVYRREWDNNALAEQVSQQQEVIDQLLLSSLGV